MQQALYDRLRCPVCRERLGLEVTSGCVSAVEDGWLDCWKCIARYPVVDHIPRFAPVDNYAENFGALWRQFGAAVLDSVRGVSTSRDQFFRYTGWAPESLKDQWILEIGCGSGRFAEIALDCGAHVVAIDYSTAVDTCWKNLGPHPRLHVVQADVYSLPFRPGLFDAVYAFGVLHRTPDARRALLALPQQLRDGGRLAFDIATPTWSRRFGPTAWLRYFTRGMSHPQLMEFARRLARRLLPWQQRLHAVPGIGPWLARWFPIAPPQVLRQATQDELQEHADLSMCDRLTATHHSPCRAATVAEWLTAADLDRTVIFQDQTVVGRGTRRSSGPPSGPTYSLPLMPTTPRAA